jgi:hypothetical protein
MKNQAFRSITLLSLFFILAAAPAYAQFTDNIVMKIHSVSSLEKTLTANEYTVRRALSTRLRLIRNANSRREYTTVLTMPIPRGRCTCCEASLPSVWRSVFPTRTF